MIKVDTVETSVCTATDVYKEHIILIFTFIFPSQYDGLTWYFCFKLISENKTQVLINRNYLLIKKMKAILQTRIHTRAHSQTSM